ncbi:four-carbon acid sugar kinase family protein [Rhizobium sp. P40RR-XXII]|uniref:four-carbon acid sugar kinase family protein n=1 Tax=unclassified Rhizobium TaxID=2613769 RepID=UPI0014569916|nr:MULTISPECIES: four-carbon acid sugar kinase family protein [unclassified Rhizobium]NLR84377.1 four-carbon acid sugar kinase family protein [Rhizobium sp. P28RR-XV]NLS14977.1 four-carbon acid sugar kinase family protein [Rhizobium sp. P40RR-XXII]
MPTLRLIADDLTGALDTAVEFVGVYGPIEVERGDALPASLPDCLAIDSGTREKTAAEAAAILSGIAPLLQGADLAFKKVDSLFRGPWAAELAACFRLGHWRHCILAPAFPHHGRHTRGGRQVLFAGKDAWRDVSGDLAAHLRAEGLPAFNTALDRTSVDGVENQPIPDGIHVFDAHSDDDLDAVIAWVSSRLEGPVLWSGTGGLARALARNIDLVRHRRTQAERDAGEQLPSPTVPISRRLQRPVLGLFGSDQPITLAQLQACGPNWLKLAEGADADAVDHQIQQSGVAMVSIDLPAGLARDDAARRIEATFGGMAKALPAPGTLIVAGGETLRNLCSALDVTALSITGQAAPGLPRSTIVGGPWQGTTVISKSGAFGGPTLWRDLLSENGLIAGGEEP